MSHQTTEQVVEHFFRHESGKIISHLTRHFGTAYLEMIEDAVQDALFKAMQVWAFNEVPQNPSGWIMRVAKNRVIDQLRQAYHSRKVGMDDSMTSSLTQLQEEHDEVVLESELKDDQLRLFFACCHPDLSIESQVVVTLKLLGGFSKSEIARALLKKDDAVAKAFTRAKNKLKEANFHPEVPSGQDLESGLNTVLKVLYLMFNEGYKASGGDELVRKDMCYEAIRLCTLLAENPVCDQPRVHALLALMYYQSSRLDARIGEEGQLLTLEFQDRSRWDQKAIAAGSRHLDLAASGDKISEYHLQASLAYCHSLAPSYAETNWEQILSLYNYMMANTPSPIVALNRIVALGKVEGPEAALEDLNQLSEHQLMKSYYLFFAIKAEMLKELGREKEAAANLQQAISLTDNRTEREFLESKYKKLQLSRV